MTHAPGVPAMAVRPATVADGPAILALDLLTWSTLTSPGPRPGPDHDVFERRAPADHLVAMTGGALAGVVNLGHPTPLPASRHVLEVQGITVHPDHRRRGVGRALLDGAVAEAVRRGCRKVSLRVLAHNDGARRLYESAGFTVEGVLRGEFLLDGGAVDDVLMARHLP